jgi:hypothetical protein
MAEQFDDVRVIFRRWLVVATAFHLPKLAVRIEDEGGDRIPLHYVTTLDFVVHRPPRPEPPDWDQ